MGFHPFLGSNVSSKSVQELYYRNLLNGQESALAVFDGILLDEQGRHVGGFSVTDFIVLTDQRVLTWARGVFSDAVDGFSWKDVDVVEAKTWDPIHGSVSLAFRVGSSTSPQRQLRVTVKGFRPVERETERVIINKLDYMPATDVPIMEEMVAWIGDQVVAGITGDILQKAFATRFTYTSSEQQSSFSLSSQESTQYAEAKEAAKPKRGWWIFGPKEEEVVASLTDSSEQLVAAYEHQRGSQAKVPAYLVSGSSSQPTGPLARSASGLTSVVDHVGVYDISRGLRLFFDTPRHLESPVSKIMSNIAENAGDLQDADLPKKAVSGFQAMINSQQQNLLGLIVEPVARIVFKSGKQRQATDENGERPGSRRRIQINSGVSGRKRESHQAQSQPMTLEEDDMLDPSTEISSSTAVNARSPGRQTVAVRKPGASAGATGHPQKKIAISGRKTDSER